MKIDEKVPVNTPKNMTSAKGRITSPPKIASASSVARVVPWVRMLRGSVSLIERFRIDIEVVPPVLVEVLPHPVEDDDRVVEGVADHREDRGHDHQAHLEPQPPMKAMVVTMSWAVAITAARPNRHSNR